jgi:hypothetical protein
VIIPKAKDVIDSFDRVEQAKHNVAMRDEANTQR